MGRIESLLANYRRHLAMPLRSGVPLSQRVWFAVYPPEEERRLISRIDDFEIATKEAALGWHKLDLTGSLSGWLDTFDEEEREQILANGDILESYAESSFRSYVAEAVGKAIETIPPDERPRTMLALTGLMELYDFVHVSAVVDAIDKAFEGVLLVFFPGEREGNTYRFLGARTGWDYLAVPILAEA